VINSAPTGRNITAQGRAQRRPGLTSSHFSKALKGRDKFFDGLFASISPLQGLILFCILTQGVAALCPGLIYGRAFSAELPG